MYKCYDLEAAAISILVLHEGFLGLSHLETLVLAPACRRAPI